MKILKYIGIILLTFILAFAGFIGYSTLTYYNPPKELVLIQNTQPDIVHCDSVMSILSWNIGYAGLGDNMDFFYDDGLKVRDSRERTINNLDSITQFLKRHSSNTFILLQEVDQHSKRSYYINQLDTFDKQPEYQAAYAPNYVVKFVPIPPSSPMGQVHSGIVSLSKYSPESSTRYGFPGQFDWPVRLFNLRRCMSVNRYPTSNGKNFVMINTHLSAFDDGSLKKQEMQFLKDFVLAEFAKGNYVIVGGDWNQAPPNFPITTFESAYQSKSFILKNIDADLLPASWKWIFDPQSPTNRYLNEAYIPGKTNRCIIDMFLVSPNIEVIHHETFNLNFKNSDHNPISMTFRLKL